MIVKKISLGALFTICLGIGVTQAQKSYLIKNVNIIDGTGAPEQKKVMYLYMENISPK